MLMFSCPPATTISESPLSIAWYPRTTALSPDPHNMFTPHAGTVTGIPAFTLACLAGFCPCAETFTII